MFEDLTLLAELIKLSEGFVISVLANEKIPVNVRLFLSLFWALKAAKVVLDFDPDIE